MDSMLGGQRGKRSIPALCVGSRLDRLLCVLRLGEAGDETVLSLGEVRPEKWFRLIQ